MSNEWLRLWHDMPNDPKWRTIARVSGQRIGDVMSVYLHVLVCASNATERGRTQSLVCEDVATALDLDTEQVEAILSAMQGRVLDGDAVRGWAKRQPIREDGAAERAKAWRERNKEASRTQANASERKRTLDTDTDKDTDTEEAKAKDYFANSPDGEPATNVIPADELEGRRKRTVIACPVARIADLWDEVLPELSSPVLWTDARKTHVSSRWREMAVHNGWKTQDEGIEWFRRTFVAIRGSPFLMGKTPPREKGKRPFKLTLDWMFGPQNFVKIVEGRYHAQG